MGRGQGRRGRNESVNEEEEERAACRERPAPDVGGGARKSRVRSGAGRRERLEDVGASWGRRSLTSEMEQH